MAKWLRGPLREIFESVVLNREELAGRRLKRGALAEIFRQHLSGETERAWGLWTLLSLALWEDRHYKRSIA